MPFNPFGMSRMESIFSTPYEKPKKRFLGAGLSERNTPFNESYDTTDFFRAPEEESVADRYNPQEEGKRYFDEIERVRRNRPSLTAYQEHIKNRPTESDENLKPSVWRRLAAAGAAAAQGYQSKDVGKGIAVGEHIARAPYQKAVEEWGDKTKVFGESAELEGKDVDQQLDSLREAAALRLKYSEYEQRKDEFDQQQEVRVSTANTRKKLADLTELRDSARNSKDKADAERQIAETKRRLDIAEAVMKTGQGNLRARSGEEAGRNARSAAEIKAADTRAANAEQGRNDRSGGGRVGLNDQNEAMNLSLRSMMNDPRWSRFVRVGQDPETEPFAIKEGAEKDPEYDKFFSEMAARMKRMLDRKGSRSGAAFDRQGDDDVDVGDFGSLR